MPRPALVLTAALLMISGLVATGCGDDSSGGSDSADSKKADTGSTDAGPAPSKGVPSPDGWPSADERRMAPDQEPSPFSAKQIAAGCGPDSKRVFRFEIPGQETKFKLWTFHDQTAEGCTFRQSDSDAKGVATGEPSESKATWKKLQSHASWAAAETTATEARMKVPAGSYECMHYVVKRTGAQGSGEDKSWFAWDLPGPPVRMERYVNGRLVFTMTLMKVQGVAK